MDLKTIIENTRVAVHESGHAVVAKALGAEIIYMTIERKGDQLGGVLHGGIKYTGDLRDAYDAMVALAGMAAEEIAFRKTIRRLSGAEFEKGSDAEVFKRVERKRGNDFVGRCYNTARQILATNWQFVNNLSIELTIKKRLHGKEVAKILAGLPTQQLNP